MINRLDLVDLRRLILRVLRNDPHRNLAATLRQLRSSGQGLDVVYDIGAHVGEWSSATRRLLPRSRFYLVEANPVHAPRLDTTGFDYEIAILSSASGEVDFWATGGTGDSIYRELFMHQSEDLKVRRQATTLDELAICRSWLLPDVIKLDTQGSEIDILHGGQCCLSSARLVILETSLRPWNEGAPRTQECVDYLAEHGFEPWAVTELHYHQDYLMQIDLMFVRA